MLRLLRGSADARVTVLLGARDEVSRLRIRQLRSCFHNAPAHDGVLLLAVRGLENFEQLRLDFSFAAPAESHAIALKGVLEEQTDYEVEVRSEGGMFRKRWLVVGATQPTAVSPAMLDQWVDWMVTAGLHQNCEFDGWGTEV